MFLFFISVFIAVPSLAGTERFDTAISYEMPFDRALEKADLIVVARTERVEVITPELPELYDRRALVKILRTFKGKSPKKEEFIYYRGKYGTEGTAPSGLSGAGKNSILFVSGKERKTAFGYSGSFTLRYYPDNFERNDAVTYCRFKAVEAYSKKRPMAEVLKLADNCSRPEPSKFIRAKNK